MKKIIPQSIKNIYHLLKAVVANVWFGFPSRKIKIIGVTGTNGKTTTTQMIGRILEEAGFKVAVASTINFKIGAKDWVNKTKYTTLASWDTQKFIRKAVREKCDYLVMETASHALDQYRVWGVKFRTAVITNVTREHLDYHKTMEAYRQAKLKLFRNVEVAVVNLDMEQPEDFLNNSAKEKYGFTTKGEISLATPGLAKLEKNKIIKAENIKLESAGSEYQILNKKYSLNLPGLFNIENALAGTCVGLSENIDQEIIKKALEKITGVPGRMEYIPNDRGLKIIVDYAVTPDALEKLYELVDEIKKKSQGEAKVISVFGACGDRDRGKRPIMAKIVSRSADYIILTNEDPYTEDPWRIIREVEAGIRNHKLGESYWKIMDRREAIGKALQLAKAGDIILVTGKGAEETMLIGNKMIPWNDKKVILEELVKIK